MRSTVILAAALCVATAHSQTTKTPQTLLATPSTVAWGFYSAHAKPALTIHSGDTLIMQTASTCGPPDRLLAEGVVRSGYINKDCNAI